MEVRVLRGADRVGENLIEVTDKGKKILLECGIALNETEATKAVEEAVKRNAYDAVVITHCHADHSGLLKEPLNARLVYMGAATRDILAYCGAICEENAKKIRVMRGERAFKIGSIEIIPHLCDHSAYDSYMIELRGDGKTALYTGDFRSNGRKDFSALLRRLPTNVDLLLVEGTNAGRRNGTERELEETAIELMRAYDRVFLLQSTLNIDRTVSFYRASLRAGKPFIMGLSAADIGGRYATIPSPNGFSNCYTYFSKRQNGEAYTRAKTEYGRKLLGRTQIAKIPRFCMQIHGGTLRYLREMDKISPLKGSLLVYSMWRGYKKDMTEFFEGVKALGIEVVDLHVSGHADGEAVEALIRRVNPNEIITVHCDKK